MIIITPPPTAAAPAAAAATAPAPPQGPRVVFGAMVESCFDDVAMTDDERVRLER